MSSPDQVTIKIEINVPTGVGAGTGAAQVQKPPPPKTAKAASASCPAPNAEHPVRSVAGMGVGAICAWVELDGDPRTEVKAIVYPQVLAHQDAAPPPCSGAVSGTQNATNQDRWEWKSGTNELRGADHLELGAPNVMYVWSRTGTGGWVPEDAIPFSGVDSADDAECCTAPSGKSGPTRLTGPVLPAVWYAELRGDVHGALGPFHARWMLRGVPGATDRTWDNGGDGHNVALIRLTLEARARWVLLLSWQGIELAYDLPHGPETALGPLKFPPRDVELDRLGRVTLPGVVVAAS